MRLHHFCALALTLGIGAAQAADASAPFNPLGGAAPALPEASLGAMRGGYLPEGGGLALSFGITRSVTIDGVLVASTTFGGVVGNAAASFSGTSAAAAAVTLVQNAADGRKVQTMTLIDASANSLGLMRQSNLQSSLRAAVIDSLRR